jgi:polysaccharide export outer membrane protein
MRPRIPIFLVLAGLLALPPAPATAQQESSYAIRPGDRITLEVFSSAGQKIDVVAGERVVDRNGDIHLPFIGTFRAQGLDQNSLRGAMVAAYGAFYDGPVVNVKVELRINITGAVGRPGQYYVDPTARVVDVLAEAGGTGVEFAMYGNVIPANPREIRLIRDGQSFIFNLHPAEATQEAMDLQVQSGDWIHVPPQTRSATRDNILFWGSIVSLLSGVASLVLLATR